MYTLCIVFYHRRNRDFYLTKKNPDNGLTLMAVSYTISKNYVELANNSSNPNNFTMPSDFNGKKIVLWLTENTNVTKVSISNYSSTLTLTSSDNANKQIFDFRIKDGVINKFLFSSNFYDFDSEQFHKIMIQEKLNGSYIV